MGFQEFIGSPLVTIVLRAVQILWSIILLGCTGWLVKTWVDDIEDLDVNPHRYTGPMSFGVFVALASLTAAAVFLAAARAAPGSKLHRGAPGVANLAVSALLALFALIAAGTIGSSFALASACTFAGVVGDMDDRSLFSRVCSASRLATAAAVFLFLTFLACAAIAVFEMRQGKGLVPWRGAAPATAQGAEAYAPQGPKAEGTAPAADAEGGGGGASQL